MVGISTPFSNNSIEAIARVLGECAIRWQLDEMMDSCGLEYESNISTKWRRLDHAFRNYQHQEGSAEKILEFVGLVFEPVRFADSCWDFNGSRQAINTVLAFSGYEVGEDGKVSRVEAARTLDEAERRVQTIQDKIRDRNIHSEVTKYCTAELMQENFFHAVFEATKGLAQRIRETSGVQGDGANLVDKVFSANNPILAFNSLQTDTERSEHKGFAALLKGCFMAIRNPLAHEPKIHWEGEDNAADYLSLISLLHRKLDECEVVSRGDETSLMPF